MNLFNQPTVRNHCSTRIHVICRVQSRPRRAVHSKARISSHVISLLDLPRIIHLHPVSVSLELSSVLLWMLYLTM